MVNDMNITTAAALLETKAGDIADKYDSFRKAKGMKPIKRHSMINEICKWKLKVKTGASGEQNISETTAVVVNVEPTVGETVVEVEILKSPRPTTYSIVI